VEDRLKSLEEKYKADSVVSALESLHRTLDKTNFDPDDATSHLETLVKCAKRTDHAKAREYECVLDEVLKNANSLPKEALRDLFIALVGDPIKGEVLKKSQQSPQRF
jgi:hypothetical protein